MLARISFTLLPHFAKSLPSRLLHSTLPLRGRKHCSDIAELLGLSPEEHTELKALEQDCCTIYLIPLSDGMAYIGETTQLIERTRQHLKTSTAVSKHLKLNPDVRALNVLVIDEAKTKKEAREKEDWWISNYPGRLLNKQRNKRMSETE